MKLLSYIFTNKLTKWGFFWRLFLIIFVPLLLASIAGIFWFRSAATPAHLSKLLSGADYQRGLTDLQLLKNDEFISLSASGIQTNKSGVFFEDGAFLVQSLPEGTCEEAFNLSPKDGLTLTPNAVCIRNNNKQQVVTATQILAIRKSIQQNLEQMNDGQVAQILAPYTGLNNLIQGDTLYIDATGLQVLLTQEVPQLLNDPSFQTKVLSLAKTISLIAIIPLAIALMFIVAFIVFVYLCIFMLYTYLTQLLFYIMKPRISYNRAFSITWLPYTFITILADWIFSMNWIVGTLLYVVLMIILIKIYKNKK